MMTMLYLDIILSLMIQYSKPHFVSSPDGSRLLRRDSLTFVEKRMAKNKDHL